jgi:hypothetical protein
MRDTNSLNFSERSWNLILENRWNLFGENQRTRFWGGQYLVLMQTLAARPWMKLMATLYKFGTFFCQILLVCSNWIFTPLRVGWPPTPQVYFGPWEGLRVVFPRGGSPS